jgi:osmoprotectant transport system permease protein
MMEQLEVALPKLSASFPRKRESTLNPSLNVKLDSRLRGNDGYAWRRVNYVGLLAALAGLLSLWLPVVVVHPSRVAPAGNAYSLSALPPGWAVWLATAWIAFAAASMIRSGTVRTLAMAIAAPATAVGHVALLTWGAAGLAGQDEFARLSIASGGWSGIVAVYIGFFSVREESRWLLPLQLAAVAAALLFAPFGHLGVVREYMATADAFHAEFIRHCSLVCATLPLVILIGFALGVFAVRKPRVESAVLGLAGFLQTIPSVALFGLLLPVLSAYGRHLTVGGVVMCGALFVIAAIVGWRFLKRRDAPAAGVLYGLLVAAGIVLLLPAAGSMLYQLVSQGWPWLAQARWSSTLDTLGVRGLGVTPAIVALTLYGLWPLVVNTHAGLKSVPAGTVEAAKGMGMSARQVFWHVEIPIAAPFFIQGVRGALLLLIGLTTIAVLVNAGGLGYFLMRGTEQAVPDLVLLGALPVVALALATDGVTRLLAWMLVPKGLRP